jgi:hypothetical protein
MALSSAATAVVAAHYYYDVHPLDRVYVDDLDLWCIESAGNVAAAPHTFACGNTSTGNGPYVRISGSKIVVAATNQRILFTVRRDR